MTTYGLPPEVEGAGAVVKSEWRGFDNFHISMPELSSTVNQWLKPSPTRAECENVAKRLAQKFTWERVAQDIVQSIEEGHQQSVNAYRKKETCSLRSSAVGTTRDWDHRIQCVSSGNQ